MPNQPRDDNPARTVRVPDDLWENSRERARERGESISQAVRDFLEVYQEGTATAMRRFLKQYVEEKR